MATAKRRKSSRRPAFEELHREQLFSGHDFLSDAYGEGDDFDEEAARADWERYGSDLMAEWFAAFDKPEGEREHGFGKPKCVSLRPWAFWRFSCPEPRPVIGNDGSNTRRRSVGGIAQVGAVFEPEYDFLKRHGLLLPGDEARRDRLTQDRQDRLARGYREF